MSDLLTATEMAPIFRKSEKTIRRWKCQGKITAEIDTGHTLLFDPEKVRKQLMKISRKPRKPKNGEIMVPTY
ncbi:MAG TPA: hypothetical protein VF258_08735 [Luteolibacter sp.]